MLSPDDGFTGWQSQNCIHTAGCLAALTALLYKVFLQKFPVLKLCYATYIGALSMAMPNRDYLFYISLWEENKPHGFVFCRNFQFPSCAMLPSDAGFTYWFSQNCIPATGFLAALATNIIKYFCQNFHF